MSGMVIVVPREGGGLARLADEHEIVVAFDDCLELRFDVVRLEQEIGCLASGTLVRLGGHADVIHAARVGAFADDLEALRGPSAPTDDVFVYLPKQNFVLSYTSRLLVQTNSPCLGATRTHTIRDTARRWASLRGRRCRQRRFRGSTRCADRQIRSSAHKRRVGMKMPAHKHKPR